jgi:hypothetical protein
MIRNIGRLYIVSLVSTALLYSAPLSAAPDVYIANSGSDQNACTSAAPCATFNKALGVVDNGGQITCIGSPLIVEGGISFGISVTIDCPGLYFNQFGGFAFNFFNANQNVRIRNLTINGIMGASSALSTTGYGTLIIENCVFDSFSAAALEFEPNGPGLLVVTNTRISNSGAGVLIKPGSNGIANASFDHVTIAQNQGGGIKMDATGSGPLAVSISDSVISQNGGNGMNAVSGGFGSVIANLTRSVIASNQVAGIQANGSSAAVLVDNSSILSNVSALSVVSGGRLLTYGNNRIVGAPGSGFSGSAPLQ